MARTLGPVCKRCRREGVKLFLKALFDEFGDNVVLCEDGHLSLVNEYAEDLQLMLDNDYTEIS